MQANPDTALRVANGNLAKLWMDGPQRSSGAHRPRRSAAHRRCGIAELACCIVVETTAAFAVTESRPPLGP